MQGKEIKTFNWCIIKYTEFFTYSNNNKKILPLITLSIYHVVVPLKLQSAVQNSPWVLVMLDHFHGFSINIFHRITTRETHNYRHYNNKINHYSYKALEYSRVFGCRPMKFNSKLIEGAASDIKKTKIITIKKNLIRLVFFSHSLLYFACQIVFL